VTLADGETAEGIDTWKALEATVTVKAAEIVLPDDKDETDLVEEDDGTYLTGVSLETDIANYLDANDGLTVLDADGNEVTQGNFGTGMVLTNGVTEIIIVVENDLDGDGESDQDDLIDLAHYIVGNESLSVAQEMAIAIYGEDHDLFELLIVIIELAQSIANS
jgi:hypothetical protein